MYMSVSADSRISIAWQMEISQEDHVVILAKRLVRAEMSASRPLRVRTGCGHTTKHFVGLRIRSRVLLSDNSFCLLAKNSVLIPLKNSSLTILKLKSHTHSLPQC